MRTRLVCSLVFSAGLPSLLPVACGGSDPPSGSPSTSSGDASSSSGSSGGGAGGAGGGVIGAVEDTPESTAPRGAEATVEKCTNGIDDDGNGYADCDDSWCRQTMELTVCDALENTPEKCSDGIDNLETPRVAAQSNLDALIDCADPDCAKRPGPALCMPRTYELGAACADGLDDDGDGLTDCDDLDCLHAGASSCPLGGLRRVLFDDAHRQRAGNSDWVVDMPGRYPWPTKPASEAAWAGLLSSFGADLTAGGYVVETLPSATGRYTFNDKNNRQDLSNFEVLIVPEASAPFDTDESDALLAFVQAGGGLLLVTDHFESDRDGNGWDSTQVWNDFFKHAGGGQIADNPFGFSVAELNYIASGAVESTNGGSTMVVGDAAHPVNSGAHGQVTRLGFHRGGMFTVYAGKNPTLSVLFHSLPLNSPSYPTSPYVVAAEVGAGRVVAIGDSAITGDGTNSHGLTTPGFDSYHEPTEQNGALMLNAVDWLAGP